MAVVIKSFSNLFCVDDADETTRPFGQPLCLVLDKSDAAAGDDEDAPKKSPRKKK